MWSPSRKVSLDDDDDVTELTATGRAAGRRLVLRNRQVPGGQRFSVKCAPKS